MAVCTAFWFQLWIYFSLGRHKKDYESDICTSLKGGGSLEIMFTVLCFLFCVSLKLKIEEI